jgi:hypothetical protein
LTGTAQLFRFAAMSPLIPQRHPRGQPRIRGPRKSNRRGNVMLQLRTEPADVTGASPRRDFRGVLPRDWRVAARTSRDLSLELRPKLGQLPLRCGRAPFGGSSNRHGHQSTPCGARVPLRFAFSVPAPPVNEIRHLSSPSPGAGRRSWPLFRTEARAFIQASSGGATPRHARAMTQ